MNLSKPKSSILTCLYLLFFLLGSLFGMAQSISVQAANEAYNAKNYTQAIELYQQLIDEEYESSELYFNLGNCYYSQDNIASAVLYYEKAKRLNYNDDRINDALIIAAKKVESRITEIPDFFLVRWNDNVANLFSSTVWMVVQFILGLIFIGLLYLILFNEQKSRSTVTGASVAFMLMLMSIHFGHLKSSLEVGGQRAVIMDEKVSLYESADERSGIVTDVSEGVTVKILTQIGDWYKVVLADKDVGWVEIKKVAII